LPDWGYFRESSLLLTKRENSHNRAQKRIVPFIFEFSERLRYK
jgi:hypothetical protein